MRKRSVEMDGEKLTISPLTLKEVEEHLRERDEIVGGLEEGQPIPKDVLEKLNILWRKFISFGLNNAQRDESFVVVGTEWNEQLVFERIDLKMLDKLRTELLVFSGLRKEEPGETTAAS